MNSLRLYVPIVFIILAIWVGGHALWWLQRGFGPRLTSTGQYATGETAAVLIRNQLWLALLFLFLAVAWYVWLWKFVLGNDDLE